MKRRHLLQATSVLVPAVLAACAGSAMTPQRIITQAVTMAAGVKGVIAQIEAGQPDLIPPAVARQIDTYLAAAVAAGRNLSATVPAASGASTVRLIEGDINAVLTTLAAPPVNGLIPPPFNAGLAAAAALLPILEAFANAYVPGAAGAAPAALMARATFAAQAPAMDANTALAILRGYTMKS